MCRHRGDATDDLADLVATCDHAEFTRQRVTSDQQFTGVLLGGTMLGGSGRCLCGAVRYRFDGPPNWQAHCHCESCRRATSAPFASFFAVDHARLHWSGAPRGLYQSSPGIFRSFCPRCGAQLSYQSCERTHEIDLYAATLDDPAAFEPTVHVYWNEHVPWLHLDDGLPRETAPRRLAAGEDFSALLALIRRSFAYMDGRINPPSSAIGLTPEGLAHQAATDEIWAIEDDSGAPQACMILSARAGHLYLGKLAVASEVRRQGLARRMIHHAKSRARALGLGTLVLQTRIELTENHAAFRALGFRETGQTAHQGFSHPTSLTFSQPVRCGSA